MKTLTAPDKYETIICSMCDGCGHKSRISGKWMRWKRESCGVSLREAAKRFGFSAAFVSDCELGRRTAGIRLEEFYLNLKPE